jgi:hypothetical protein
MRKFSVGSLLILTASAAVGFAILAQLFGHRVRENTMKSPHNDDPWVIRTEFLDDQQWAAIQALISAPRREFRMEFRAHVKFVNNDGYRDQEPEELVHSLPDNYPYKFCFVVDRQCTENQEHPVLVVGFYPRDHKSYERRPRSTPTDEIATFRALPNQIQSIENNLSIANMDFEEFANRVDADGVFRGLPPLSTPGSK